MLHLSMDQKIVNNNVSFSLMAANQSDKLTDRHFDLSFPQGAYPSWAQDDIFHVSICDAPVNIVVKPPMARNLLLLKAA